MLLIKYSFLVFFLTLSVLVNAQSESVILGKITDDEGNNLPFATVYVEGTTNGTTSNNEGNYQLKVSKGTHAISVQHIGYAKKTRTVNVQSSVGLDFQLAPENLILHEVVVSAKNKNPAYRIVKEAIKKRKYFEKEVQAYQCKAYIKGIQRLDKKPNSLLGMTITVDTGIVYLSESLSKVNFERPDNFYEEMIASKFSGKANGFSYNRASEMIINIYQNSFFIEGLSERSFISPIANSAFISYDYKLDGVIYEDDVIINKIRVIPRRSTDPTFSGHIYIIENSWRLHSVDVRLTKDNGIDFVDSLSINQIYAAAQYDIWMPISQKFSYQFKAFGFRGSGQFTANYSEYVLEPNYEIIQKQEPQKDSILNKTPKVDLFTKKEFGNSIMSIEEGSNKKDDLFWKEIRPMPLTKIETQDYHIKDSIQVITESKPYQDSVDRVKNKFRPANLFFNGYSYFNSYRGFYINFPTALELTQYNTIEGFAPEASFRIRKDTNNIPTWEIKPSLKYGFGNKRFQAKIAGFYTLNYKNRAFVYGGTGRYTSQFNSTEPISPVSNTWFTLVEGENFLKAYQSSFVYIGYQQEVLENVRINGKIEIANRNSISNTSDFSFDSSPTFTSNLSNKAFQDNLISKLTLNLTFRPGTKYIDRPDRKFYLGSKYPTFSLTYDKAIPLLGNNNFDFLRFGTKYDFRIGLAGESMLQLETGTFLNKRSLTFIDFKHFNGNQIYLRPVDSDLNFQLLPYYDYSTTNNYVQLHYEHHFNEFIFNKLPLIKKLNLQSVLSLNYLSTKQLPNYLEAGFGIEHIFKFLRVDYFTSFNKGKFESSGVRIGAGF